MATSTPTTVLCFGDSNTWGLDPQTRQRFDTDTRWPGALRRILGPRFQVIEEGLSGRTTMWDDPEEPDKNGLTYLRPCLDSHRPLDVVVVMLGSNDLKARFGLDADQVASGAATITTAILQSGSGRAGQAPRVVLISPPLVQPPRTETADFANAGPMSAALATLYRSIAERFDTDFIDAAPIAPPSQHDGLHLTASSHLQLARAVAALLQADDNE